MAHLCPILATVARADGLRARSQRRLRRANGLVERGHALRGAQLLVDMIVHKQLSVGARRVHAPVIQNDYLA